MANHRPSIDVLAERIAALDRRLDSVIYQAGQLDSRVDDLATKNELKTFTDQSRQDRQQLHDAVGELRLSQRSFMSSSEAQVAHEALRKQMDYLQGAVNRMLITLLSSLVLALITALIYDLLQRN